MWHEWLRFADRIQAINKEIDELLQRRPPRVLKYHLRPIVDELDAVQAYMGRFLTEYWERWTKEIPHFGFHCRPAGEHMERVVRSIRTIKTTMVRILEERGPFVRDAVLHGWKMNLDAIYWDIVSPPAYVEACLRRVG